MTPHSEPWNCAGSLQHILLVSNYFSYVLGSKMIRFSNFKRIRNTFWKKWRSSSWFYWQNHTIIIFQRKAEQNISNFFDVLFDRVQLQFFVYFHLGIRPSVDLDHHVDHCRLTRVRVQGDVMEWRYVLITPFEKNAVGFCEQSSSFFKRVFSRSHCKC